MCSQDVRLLGSHRHVGRLDALRLTPQYSSDLPWQGSGQGGSLWSHRVGRRRSLVSSSELVPVDSMGPSVCPHLQSRSAVVGVLYCFGFDYKK